VKATGKRSAGKPHAAFDEGEQATVARIRLVRHRQTKGAATDRRIYGHGNLLSTLPD